jgi:hypothetical protein
MDFELAHLAALAFSFIVIAIADHDGWRYFRGRTATLSPARLARLHTLAWVGLGGMVVTGMVLVIQHQRVLDDPLFPVKMLMVLALVINGALIGRLMKVATTTPFAALNMQQRLPLFLSGAVSVCCWIGATVLGFVM